METIVKHNDAAANALIDPYLTWAQTQWWYGENCGAYMYNKLRLRDANGYNNRQRLIDEVLLPEQQHRCCYCMRHIVDRNDDASIEHIVPQHAATNAEIILFRLFPKKQRETNGCLIAKSLMLLKEDGNVRQQCRNQSEN